MILLIDPLRSGADFSACSCQIFYFCRMKKVLYLLGLLLLPVYFAKAQDDGISQTIRGRVIDMVSRAPLPGATVIIPGSTPLKGTVTDADGWFRLNGVPVGRVNLQVSFIGYLTRRIDNLDVTSGKQSVLTIELQEKVVTTDAVVITAKTDKAQPLNAMATVSARSFTVEETDRYAGSLGDPSRMAANYAGVYAADDSRNDIIIRGNSPLGLLWRIEGIDVPNPNHFGAVGTTGGPVSMLNTNLLANSDFFTGAFPAEYGNAISGVFDLRLRQGNNEHYEFTGQVGFNGFELGAEGPFSKKHNASFLANYRYSTPRIFSLIGIDFSPGSSVPDYQDATFKVDIPTGKAGKFEIFGIGGLSSIKLYDSEKDDDEFSYGLTGTDTDFGARTGIFGITHSYFFNPDTRLKSYVAVTGAESTTSIDSIVTAMPLQKAAFYRSVNSEVKYSASTQLEHKFNARSNVTAGLIADWYDVIFSDSVYNTDEYRFVPITDARGGMGLLRGFVEWQYRFGEDWLMNSGLYSQVFTLNGSSSLEPRLGLKWNLAPGQSLGIACGLLSQTQPKMTYFVITRTNAGNLQTNRDMGFTRSQQWVLGYDRMLAENFRIKLETYYQYLFDVPVKADFPEFSMLNEGGYFAISLQDSLVNKGKGYNYGAELTLEKFFSRGYYFLLTGSLFESKYRGYDGILRSTAFNSNYVINALGGYEIAAGKKNRLTFDLRAVYAGGRRYTPIDVAESIAERRTERRWEQAYSHQYDPYFTLDVKLGFKMNLKKADQEFALEIKNLTNHHNIFQQLYDPVNHRIKTDYQQGLFPIMFYRIRF